MDYICGRANACVEPESDQCAKCPSTAIALIRLVEQKTAPQLLAPITRICASQSAPGVGRKRNVRSEMRLREYARKTTRPYASREDDKPDAAAAAAAATGA